MKDLVELATFIVIVCGLVFVFQGEPDLWDKWHAQAMQGCKQ